MAKVKRQKHIQQYGLSPAARAGVLVIDLKKGGPKDEHDVFDPHKDDHYLLLIGTGGRYQMMVDFQMLKITAPAVMLLHPGQVHQIMKVVRPSGWAISFDPSLIDDELQHLLEMVFTKPFALNKNKRALQQFIPLVKLLVELQHDIKNTFSRRALHEILRALLSLLTGSVMPARADSKTKESRGAVIEFQFRQLLKQHYKAWKQPAEYARALSISVAHLNDTIKSLSGTTVSAHLQEKAILEAKRLLYFTNLSVKEIGYAVGYDDPIYFSKLFRKLTKTTPLLFRSQFRD